MQLKEFRFVLQKRPHYFKGKSDEYKKGWLALESVLEQLKEVE